MKMFKKLICTIMVLAMILSVLAVPTFAGEKPLTTIQFKCEGKLVELPKDKPVVMVDVVDESHEPYRQLYIPLAIFNKAMGISTSYDSKTNTVLMVKGKDKYTLKVGGNKIYKNGTEVALSRYASKKIDGVLYVPENFWLSAFKMIDYPYEYINELGETKTGWDIRFYETEYTTIKLDGKELKFSNSAKPYWNNDDLFTMVPLAEMCKNFGTTATYNSKTGLISFKYNGHTLSVNSKVGAVDGYVDGKKFYLHCGVANVNGKCFIPAFDFLYMVNMALAKTKGTYNYYDGYRLSNTEFYISTPNYKKEHEGEF